MLRFYVLLGIVLTAIASLAAGAPSLAPPASNQSHVTHSHFVFEECGDNDECWNKYKSLQKQEPGYIYQSGKWESGGDWSLVQMDLDQLRAAGGKMSLPKRGVTPCHILTYPGNVCAVTYCWRESSGSTVTAALKKTQDGSLISSESYTLSDNTNGNYYTNANKDEVRADLYWATNGNSKPITRPTLLNQFTPFCGFTQIFCASSLIGNVVAWSSPSRGVTCTSTG